ncbi:hypothetical protein Tco_1515075 [Tanacetum coccineum]
MTTKAQQSTLDNVLVAPENQRVIGKCNMRINPRMKPKEPTYQAALDALALTTCYPAFLITAEVLVIYMHQSKGLNVLLEVALSEAGFSLKEAIKRSKKDFLISQASGSDDDEDDTEDDKGNDDNDGNDDDDDNDGDDDDDNDGDDDDDNDGNDDDSQFNEEHEEEEEEEENVDEFTDKEDDEENKQELTDGEELYKDVNVKLRKEDVEMTDANQGGADQHNVSQELGFEQSHSDNEIASLMDTIVRHEEPSSQTSTLFTMPITVIPTHIPPPPHFFNPLPQQVTPAPTPTTSEATTSFPALPNFSFVFKFNDRVTKLETDLSKMKQVDQYAQAISSIPAIVDHYINNKLGEAIHKAIQSHNAECREEAQAKKQEYIDLVDTSSKNYKILLDKIKESKSHLRADYKRKLYDALVESYNTEKDLFNTYGENQEFDTGNNDEQPDDEADSKNDWFKKPKRPLNPDPNWNKRQHVDFRQAQTWIKLLVGPAFSLLKGTCKSLMELEYHFEEFSKATTERLDSHNPEGKPYPFDLRKPLLLIPDHRGHQVIPQDYFINNDLEYLKGGNLSRQYSTSVTKTKAATYEIKWIKDMVPNL